MRKRRRKWRREVRIREGCERLETDRDISNAIFSRFATCFAAGEGKNLDTNNKYGGFEKYGAAYRNRTHKKANPRPSSTPKEEKIFEPSAFDYIETITSQFNLNPTPILRPTTSERDRSSRPKTSERVKFNEPVEPFVPTSMRQEDNRPRATLHQHQANERIRQSQRRQRERDKVRVREGGKWSK